MRRSSGILLLLAAGCGGEDPAAFCPVPDDRGPALGAGPHLLVATSLGEEWVAVPLSGPLAVLPERGLTGPSPNDLDLAGDRLLVVNSGDNTVTVIDPGTGSTLGCIDVGAGANPWELVVDPLDPDRAWVTTFLGGEVVELDLAGRRVRRRAQVGPAAEGLLVTAEYVLVTLTGFNGTEGDFGPGRLVALRRDSLAPVADLPVPPNPQAILAGADGLVHVICTGNFDDVAGQVVRVEPDFSSVRDTLHLGGSPARAVLDEAGVAWVSAYFGGLLAYDTRTFTAVHDAANPLLPQNGYTGLAYRDGVLYAANFELDAVIAVRVTDGSVAGEVRVGDGPVPVVVR